MVTLMSQSIEIENIAAYVASEQRTFSEKPITDVDLLVFSSLAYLEFESYPEVFGCELSGNYNESCVLPISLKDIPDALPEEADIHSLLDHDSDRRRSLVLLDAVLESPRFSTVAVLYFECFMSDKPHSSYAGVAFALPDSSAVIIAFRGTDTTASGWLDSLRMMSLETTPGLRRSTALIDDASEVLEDYRDVPIYVCGHSKGGTLAEHALLMCSRRAARRVVRAVSFDGPALFCLGDRAEPELEEFDVSLLHRYKMGRPIVRYIFPSMIGLSLERRDPYQFTYLASVDGKPRHGTNFILIRDGEFVTFEPTEEQVSEALYTSRLFPLLNEDERLLASKLLYEACKDTGIAADLSGRFIKQFALSWNKTVQLLDGEEKKRAEIIEAKTYLAEEIILPFEDSSAICEV